jgi:hypothetical protein
MKRVPKDLSQRKASRQLLYIILGLAFGLAGLSGLIYGVVPTKQDLGSPLIAGSFTMIGHDGSVVKSADFAGRPYCRQEAPQAGVNSRAASRPCSSSVKQTNVTPPRRLMP